MRFRESSELGWLMLQTLGALCLPYVTRDAQAWEAARNRALIGRQSGKRQALFDQLTEGLFIDSANLHPKQQEFASVDSGRYASKLADAKPTSIAAKARRIVGKREIRTELFDVDRRVEELSITTYDSRDSLWWLSWADDHQCAGVAIVQVIGEPSTSNAAHAAEVLGLVPEGAWQLAAIQIPEEERAQCEPHAGRFLTTKEAETIFQAQSIRSWEAENPDRPIDTSEIGVIDP